MSPGKHIRCRRVALALAGLLLSAGVSRGGSVLELLPGFHWRELGRIESPDGRGVAVVTHRELLGFGGPPEPPPTRGRWARLKVTRNGRTVYDSGYEGLNIYQMSPGHALDGVWSPDSSRLAYRHIASLRVIEPDGRATFHNLAPTGSVITSFGWMNNDRLLVVSKKTRYPLDSKGTPLHYEGYTDNAKEILIMRLDRVTGATNRHHQIVDNPTLMFHAIDFSHEEVSPKGNRVVFSDGANVCVYDDAANRLVVKIPVPQRTPKPTGAPEGTPPEIAEAVLATALETSRDQLDGAWWPDNDTVVLGVALLVHNLYFYTLDVRTGTLTDMTATLRPLWQSDLDNMNYLRPRWYRSGLRKAK